jgi:FMN-dependent NADH-azoreductase
LKNGGSVMSKLLYIKANPKNEKESYTLQLSEAFINEYKKQNPNDEVVTLDLYKEEFKPLSDQMLKDLFSGNESIMRYEAKKFASMDKYVFAAPMWNFGIPGILKLYIDYIIVAGTTFKFTESGAVGLLADQGKKMLHIAARGGAYETGSYSQYEMGSSYLKNIMGFIGVHDNHVFPFEMTNILSPEELQKNLATKTEELKNIAREF